MPETSSSLSQVDLSERTQLPMAMGRLPTRAERVRAARGKFAWVFWFSVKWKRRLAG
jgi:hypothetical protein